MRSPGTSVFAPVLVAGDATLAMRASSWGDVGEYGRFAHAHEASSMHSGAGDHEEPLDPDVVVVGAGGVAFGPLPPTPSASAGVLAAGGLAPPYVTPAEVLCRVVSPPPGGPLASTSRGSHGSGFGAVASATMASRWHPSPPNAARSLMGLSSSYSSEEQGGVGNGNGGEIDGHHHVDNDDHDDDDDDDDDDGSDGDSDSFFARNSEEVARPRVVGPDAPRAVFHHHLHQHHHEDGDDDDDDWGAPERRTGAGRGKSVYGEDDDDDDASDGDSGGPPIEVRRRRPSWTVHDDDGDDGPPPPPSPPS
jgi:hypothetical protein